MLKKRKKLTAKQVSEKSECIVKQIFENEQFKEARVICVYLPSNNEVDTSLIFEEAFKQGKRVCAPKVDIKTKTMNMFEFNAVEQLKKGPYNILEPFDATLVEPDEIDIIFVPGVAFSENLHRIGYGAGYYDKYLKKMKKDSIKIGLAFDFQLTNDWQYDEHDFKLDMIICDK